MDATPEPVYESYNASLSAFGGPLDEVATLEFVFGFAPTPVKPTAGWWDDCGVIA